MNTLPFDYNPDAAIQILESLREEAALWISEIQELEAFSRPELQARYQILIGKHELHRLELQYNLASVRRRLSLAQRSRNLWAVEWTLIKAQVARELAQWEIAMADKKKLIHNAQQYISTKLPHIDHDNLKQVYRELVKMLHPELYDSQSEQQQQLWLQVNAAYRDGDLDSLEDIHHALHENAGAKTPSDLVEPSDQSAKLRALTQRCRSELELLRKDPVFALRVQLSDPTWIRLRCQDIEFACRAFTSELKDLSLAISFVPITFPPWPVNTHDLGRPDGTP